ncbi:hypothetical protein [Cytobacillus praedii]|uniref:Uncharacterized protein n=1 Tax=Cytobacillus praedii TaxID=1742358 RepID=A0A4R1ANZ1_9BACI|nr:hypothetical protein [Cytobacillus praedii]TCJ01054.1 hypothetical protein E0Y62_25895 [Cytobacillus praedii]
MFKGKKEMVRTVFNNVHEANINPVKRFYGTISTSNGSLLVTHESISRSEAVAIFEEEARLSGGRLDKYIGVL